MKSYCLVAADTAFNNSILVYEQPEDLMPLEKGMLVAVPLGKRLIKGCILTCNLSARDLDKDLSIQKIKPVHHKIDSKIKIDEDLLMLLKWMSSYYHYDLGRLIFDILPGELKKPRKLNFVLGEGKALGITANHDQENALLKIIPELTKGYSKWLIHGVTGSGKTFIYLNLIKAVLEKGKSVLFILPEINLTPQFLFSFQQHLMVPIYSYNSSINSSDKFGLWTLLQESVSPKVIIGVRSSVFLPIKNLGLIIVDEEHDQSLKQDDRCSYNARDVAIKRASTKLVPIILGSATPALESYYFFSQEKNKNYYIRLKNRANFSPLPEVKFIDMRCQEENEFWPFKQESLDRINEVLNKGEQVIIYVNQLGFARYLQCRACGHKFICPNCSLNLRYFKERDEVSCNYCSFMAPCPEMCPSCFNLKIYQRGYGTERLQKILKEKFSQYRVERFDRDELTTIKKIEQRLKDFAEKKIDILVGTQMISKGHDFKNTNLVLVLGTDAQMNYPDFRSLEKVFQQLVQVSGRSGRFGQKSEVLVHTFDSTNRVYGYLGDKSDEFYAEELAIRKSCLLPPFAKISIIYFTSRFKEKVKEQSLLAKHVIDNLISKAFPGVIVLGPRASIIEKKVNRYTWVLMLKSDQINPLHNVINSFKKNFQAEYSTTVNIDMDPYNID